MSANAPAGSLQRRDARIALLWSIAAAIALTAWLAPPYAQPASYHLFADQRAFLGIPNFLNVTSNLAFLVVGLAGLRLVLTGTRADGTPAFTHRAERRCWGLVCATVALTCAGSWYYHLLPDSERLAWDRLPMAMAFTGVLAATVSERVSARAGAQLLAPLALLGAATVWYWRWSAARGFENLNPYAAVQFGSLLMILLVTALFSSRYTRGADVFGAVALYALAKAAEHFDRQILVATGEVVSGHTLKHLLAAAAMLWLVRMLMLRRSAQDRRTSRGSMTDRRA